MFVFSAKWLWWLLLPLGLALTRVVWKAFSFRIKNVLGLLIAAGGILNVFAYHY